MTEPKKASRTSIPKPAIPTAGAKGGATGALARKGAAGKSVPAKSSAAKPEVKPMPQAAARPRRARPKPVAVSSEQRRDYVAVAAYYIAARRGFAAGDPMQDWVQAEAEVDRLLGDDRAGTRGD